MSLVGSLEDLGLGDILQIVSLSRKSGVLWIRSPAGEGQILFADGLIRGVFAQGGPTDLRELAAAQLDLSKADLDAAAEEARALGRGLGDVLGDRGLLSRDAREELLRDHLSSTVLGMFAWATGEFSFEISDSASADEDLFVSPGLNPQFLALEGTRIQDEVGRFDAPAAPPPGSDPIALPEPEFLEEVEPLGPGELLDEGVLLESVELEDGVYAEAEIFEIEPIGPADVPVPEARPIRAARNPEPAAIPETPPPRAPVTVATRTPPPVVVIDPDLAVLEWVKRAVAAAHRRVHIFQRSEQGISRIRQYLARAETPLVLLAADAPADPLSGARDASEMVRRLKAQAPRMLVFQLERAGVEADPGASFSDGALTKPSAGQLADPRRAGELDGIADALVRALDRCRDLAAPAESASGIASLPPDTLTRLRELSARLRDPGSQGEVLSLVMGFAAETFSRVAMFMLRDQRAIGMAQVGLPRGGGPDDLGLAEVALPAREPGWFRRVIDSKGPIRGAPEDEGDQRLAVLLGNAIPREVYVAPIESGDRIVALLYADNLPSERPIGDTSALEVVLHEAGLALDRALLERALAEAQG